MPDIIETANQAAGAGEKTAAMKYANVQRDKQPRRWEAIQQLGKVPAWELIVESVDETCDNCLLRDVAQRRVLRRPQILVRSALRQTSPRKTNRRP